MGGGAWEKGWSKSPPQIGLVYYAFLLMVPCNQPPLTQERGEVLRKYASYGHKDSQASAVSCNHGNSSLPPFITSPSKVSHLCSSWQGFLVPLSLQPALSTYPCSVSPLSQFAHGPGGYLTKMLRTFKCGTHGSRAIFLVSLSSNS